MRLKLGDAIVVQCISSHNEHFEQPAIVNRVWGFGDTIDGPQMVNCTVLPDCGLPFNLTSVPVHDNKPETPLHNTGWVSR